MYAGWEMAMCIEKVDLAPSHPVMLHTDLDALQKRHESVIQRIFDLDEKLLRAEEKNFQLKRDVKEGCSSWHTTKDEVDVKSKALSNLEVVPTLSRVGLMELNKHEQVMLEMQSSLIPNTWMDAA